MKPSVVFIHGFGGSARSWDKVIARLGASVQPVALDLPGFGEADAAAGPFDVAARADFVEALAMTLNARDLVVVGHSMGGKIALALAARNVPGLRALVLLAPSPPTPEPIEDVARAEAIAGWGEYSYASRTLARATAGPLADDDRRRAIDDMMRSGKAAWNAWLEQGSRENISALMPRVEAPVTMLSGTCDTVLPTPLLRREVADRLNGARVITVAGAGHLLTLEAPDAVSAAIAQSASDIAPRKAGAPVRRLRRPSALGSACLAL